MIEKLKLLILIKNFAEIYPKHQHKYDMISEFQNHARVTFWEKDGDILDILKQVPFKPDFIMQYETIKAFSPIVTNLDKIDIPKGLVMIDPQSKVEQRIDFIESNQIDLIFSMTREGFLKYYPQYQKKMRWFPFSINQEIIKDWKLEKEYDYLLMGLIFINIEKSNGGGYFFREAVLNKMKNVKGFKYIPHPGHCAKPSEALIVNEKYGKLINKAKIFFTSGSVRNFPVAKFFEIPGCRTLLVAKPNKDIYRLGFKDRVNFVACNEYDFYKKASYYLQNESERKRITDNGYKFVHTFHTNQVRAKQCIEYIREFIKTKNLNG